jgi:hypothetical protein
LTPTQHACGGLQHGAPAQQQSSPQHGAPASQHAAPGAQHECVALSEQQSPQSAAHCGQPPHPSAQAGQGTAQQVTGPRAWAEFGILTDSQPVRPARDRTTANSDLVAVMIRSPLLEKNADTSAVDGRRTGTIYRRDWARAG